MGACCQPPKPKPPIAACCHAAPPPATGWRRWWKSLLCLALGAANMALPMAVMPAPFSPGYWWVHGFLMAGSALSFAWLGWPMLRGSLEALREGRPSLEAIFLLSSLAALALSVHGTLTGGSALYYDVLPVVLAIYWVGAVLGERSRRDADAALAALRTELDTVRVAVPGGAPRRARRAELAAGDRVLVLGGETIPVDGRVLAGAATVVEAAITGEPFPVAKASGAAVHAGSVLVDEGHLEILPSAGATTRLDGVLRAVDQALMAPNRLQREADRLLGWFLPLVVAAALATLAGWSLAGQPEAGFRHLLAVLLVACPCALGLATPIAVVAALHRLGRLGLAPRDGDVILRLSEVDTVVLDKTGTLGEGTPRVVALRCAPGVDEARLRAVVAAIEALADHPLARALAGLGSPASLPGLAVRAVPGLGVIGSWDGGEARIGEPGLLPPGGDLGFASDIVGKRVIIALDGKPAAVVALQETLRPDAAPAIAALRGMGLGVEILTGDPHPAWSRIEGAEVHPGLSPAAKARRVRARMAEGRRVLFVGDGLNDLEGMSAAHASIAMAAGADLTRHACHAVLAVDRLRALPEAVALARRVRADLRRNLLISLSYNGVGVGLAAAGILEPWSAALVMLVSSLLVGVRAARSARPEA